MRNKYTLFLFSFLFFCSAGLFAQTVTFNYTGAMQTYTVPPCVTSVTIQAAGARGGGPNGGNGATVSGTITVSPGDVLEIWVGGMGTAPGAGFNGGGAGTTASSVPNYGFGGGGASDVRIAPYGLGNRVIVAAGGGGTGGGNTDGAAGVGGCGAGTDGDSPFGQGGYGATSTAGGAGGPPWITSGFAGSPGSLGMGGAGATDPCYNVGPGGGGGGGYYGGGGGGSDCWSSGSLGGGGGGGGSSLTPAGGTCTAGNNATDGLVTITPNTGTGTTMSVLPAAPTICVGSSVVLNASGAMSYTWSPATGLSSTTGASVTANPTTTTTYTLYGTGACNDSVLVTVTVDPVPTVNVGSINICNGASGTLTATGASTYSWSPATGLSATTGSSVTANPITTTTYTITGTTVGGCTNTTNATVTVDPLPTVNVNSGTACAGFSVPLTATGADTYTWSPATGLSSTTGATVSASPGSTTTYTVTGTSAAGCTGTATSNVTIDPTPVVSVAPATICSGTSTTLTASGAATYTWSPATGLSATTGSSVTANPGTTTTYTVTGTSAAGCVGTTTVTVTVNPLPVLSVPPVTICNGTPEAVNASGAATYTWSPAAGLSATTGATVMASPSATTTYTVTGTSAAGCVSTTTVVITVDVLPMVSASPNMVSICAGGSASITASGAATYTWTPATGLSATTGATVTASPSSTTIYTLTGTSATGCNNSIVVPVTVNPLPTVTVNSASICLGDDTVLTASGAATYTWVPSFGLTATTGATVTSAPTSTTTYTVTGTSAAGCPSTATAVVNVIDPTASFTASPATGLEPLNVTFINNSSGNIYYWDFGNGLDANTTSSSPNASTTYDTTGIYTVMLISAEGPCVDTTYLDVEVLPVSSLLVPNIITANNDGKNDDFRVIGVALKSLDVKIFNRWGQLVGTLATPDDTWDGSNHTEGTYFYLLKAEGLEGAQYEQQGSFSLVK